MNEEFNLRHDWNSLISHDRDLLFTKYSKEYFPHADRMVDYLTDFAKKLNLKVQYDTEIGNITYNNDTSICKYSMNDNKNNRYCGKYLIVANGIDKPFKPELPGSEYLTGYEDLSLNPDDYEGEQILILGRGNAGMETAQSVYGSAAYVHLLARTRIRFSWDTHYVGDIRGVNNEVLDSYMLKSLDGVFEASIDEITIEKRESDGKFVLTSPAGNHYIDFEDSNPIRDGYDRIISCLGFHWDRSLFNTTNRVHFAPISSNLRGGRHKKFPHVEHNYGSIQYPGLYFAGPLIHSLDFRKAAGGFIHGFRYTTRALSHLLEWKNHGVAWPSVTQPWDQIVAKFMKRSNEGSGIYQMFQTLGDVAIVHEASQTFTYLEEFPINLLPNLTQATGHSYDPKNNSLFVLVLAYGANFSKAGVDHFGSDRVGAEPHLSNFLHPVFFFYKDLPSFDNFTSRRQFEILPNPVGIHHIREDFTTNFDGPTEHILPTRTFFEHYLNHDLRTMTADDCLIYSMSLKLENGFFTLPPSCQRYISNQESAFLYTQHS